MSKKTKLFQPVIFLFGIFLSLATTTITSPSSAMSIDEIRQVIVEEAMETSVPTSLALAVVKTESNFRADHEGSDGARGLMQILPDTAESLGLNPASLWQVRPNIRAGLSILEGVLDRTDGRWEEAVQAYGSNRRKPGSVKNQRYVTAVLKSERQYAEQLAAVDALSERRREVLAGHDDWGSAPEQQEEVARVIPEENEPHEPEQVFEPRAFDDNWEQETREPPEVTIFRGNGGQEIEIIIYEEEQWQRPPPPPPVFRRDWRPPPPRHFRPRMHKKRWFNRGPRFARSGGPRRHRQRSRR